MCRCATLPFATLVTDRLRLNLITIYDFAIPLLMMQYTTNRQGTVTDSMSVGVQLTQASPADAGSRRRLGGSAFSTIIVLQNLKKIEYDKFRFFGKSGTLKCSQAREPYSISITCGSNVTLSRVCNGTSAGEISYQCPSQILQPGKWLLMLK